MSETRYKIIYYYNHLKIKIMSAGKVFLGVLAGVAAGAVLGILFAPARGRKPEKRYQKKEKSWQRI